MRHILMQVCMKHVTFGVAKSMCPSDAVIKFSLEEDHLSLK